LVLTSLLIAPSFGQELMVDKIQKYLDLVETQDFFVDKQRDTILTNITNSSLDLKVIEEELGLIKRPIV